MKNRKHIHRLLGVRVGPTDGSQTIVGATRVFGGNIDKMFWMNGFGRPGRPTPPRNLVAYTVDNEFTKESRLEEVFSSTGILTHELLVEESEVVEFCQHLPEELRGSDLGIFLVLKRGKILKVAGVYPSNGGLSIVRHDFDHPGKFVAGLSVRIVVPH